MKAVGEIAAGTVRTGSQHSAMRARARAGRNSKEVMRQTEMGRWRVEGVKAEEGTKGVRSGSRRRQRRVTLASAGVVAAAA